MFEDSLFASRVAVRPARSRWAAVIALFVQGAVVTAMLVAPMLRPLALPMLKTAPTVVSVNLRKPEVKVESVKVRPTLASNDATMRAPAAAAAALMLTRGGGRITPSGGSSDTGPVLLAERAGDGFRGWHRHRGRIWPGRVDRTAGASEECRTCAHFLGGLNRDVACAHSSGLPGDRESGADRGHGGHCSADRQGGTDRRGASDERAGDAAECGNPSGA